MTVKNYKVTCKDCGGSSGVQIDDLDRIYWNHVDKVISGRKRLDKQWGFQCYCGNNDLETDQERKQINNLSQPEPQEIQSIVDNLKVQQSKFIMLEV